MARVKVFSSKSLLQCKMEVINRTNSRKFSVIIYNIYIYMYIYIYIYIYIKKVKVKHEETLLVLKRRTSLYLYGKLLAHIQILILGNKNRASIME